MLVDKKITLRIAGASVSAAISAILGVFPPFIITPWFMRIDLVAVPWIICWIIFGFKVALFSALISIPIVGFFEPFAGGWIGGIMKFVSSIWMFTVPALFAHRVGGERSLLQKKSLFLLSAVAAIIVRDLVSILFNFYFAIPVFFGMTTEQLVWFFTNFRSFVGLWIGVIGLGAFIFEIVFWNTVQGCVDIGVSWLVGSTVLRRIRVKE